MGEGAQAQPSTWKGRGMHTGSALEVRMHGRAESVAL